MGYCFRPPAGFEITNAGNQARVESVCVKLEPSRCDQSSSFSATHWEEFGRYTGGHEVRVCSLLSRGLGAILRAEEGSLKC